MIITLARKDLMGTVAQNALRYGTGGLNIDACRVQGPVGSNWSNYVGHGPAVIEDHGIYGTGRNGAIRPVHSEGRWPANMLLEHKSGCQCVGERQVKTGIAYEPDFGLESNRQVYGSRKTLGRSQSFAGKDGLETIPAWDCEPDCPVADLDGQSGDRRSAYPDNPELAKATQGKQYGKDLSSVGFGLMNYSAGKCYSDSGSASRFFFQIQHQDGDNMNDVPQQLTDYLVKLISPPPRFGQAFVLGNLSEVDWQDVATWADNSISGFIARGEPTPEQSSELFRVMKPGAHICLIAPEDEPLGIEGACTIEDTGFEIRDAILWVREAGEIYYVPKASRTERELGCSKLPVMGGFEAVNRKEGSVGLQCPGAGAGRTATEVHNHHPCVKPRGILEALLQDVDTSLPVLDPFIGSGATGIACLKTGHSFIGIDMEPDYLRIADARIRYWANAEDGWAFETNIVSDTPTNIVEEKSFEQSFWGDD